MKRSPLCAMLASACTATLVFAPGAAQARPVELIKDQYICVFKPWVKQGDVKAQSQRAAKSQGAAVLHTYGHTIHGFAVHVPEAKLAAMKAASGAISYCEQDQIMSLPEASAKVSGKPGGTPVQPPQSTPWGIARVNGGGATYSGSGVVWVIDTGIDLDHPDLNVDVADSTSFLRDSSPDDGNGHGTHVSGIIAACNNSIGVVGVAPCAPVASVRVLDRNGRGANSGVIAGINYVAAHGKAGDVANLSLGGGASDALDQAVIDAAATSGVKFSIAAGNDSADANGYSPARANGTNIYTVSAFGQGDAWAYFSNYGNPPIDFGEPGYSIYSTFKDASYLTLSGTSMAAPHLAGILLLGAVKSGGTVSGDPDGAADTIGVH